MADNFLHHSHLRMRVVGTGNLDVRLIGLYETTIVADNPPTQSMVPYPMLAATPNFAQFHANFDEQYTQIEISTDQIDEWFKITKIVTYVKETAVALPM
jgi:hypothetical protein